jgi:hypothetical protein
VGKEKREREKNGVSGERVPLAAIVLGALRRTLFLFPLTSLVSPLALSLLPLTLCVSRLSAQLPEDEPEFPQEGEEEDSVGADTINTTARYLKEQAQLNVRVPVLPAVGVEGPRPPLTRIVFTHDSIEWANAATVSDLLTQVPGVYLWRGGYIGRPELVNYRGRGASSVEYFLDGIPYVAAGIDSIAVDPALFSLELLDRIEVQRWPGQLQVHLFTRQHDRLASRSRLAIARGDNDFARYDAELQRRFQSGIGFSLAADYLNSPTASGVKSDYSNTQIWAQGSYHPTSWVGLQYQLIRSAPNRRPFIVNTGGVNDTIGPGYKGTRSDAQLRLSLRKSKDELGPRADLIYSRTGWDGAGLDQQIDQLGGYLTYRTPVFSLSGSAFHRTRWTPLDARVTVGLSPVGPLSASAELIHMTHFGGRASNYANLAAGLEPVRGLSLTGTARIGTMVAAPAILTDPKQDVKDFQAALGWNRARLGFEVSYSRTSAFRPFGYADFPNVPQLAPSSATEWLTASVRLAPLPWITLETWYSDPRGVSPDGIPPKLSTSAATLRSKFLREFPSGIFDLKLRLSMDSWSPGTIGRDALGNPINLRGATFFRSLIQFQLDRFSLYWDRGNLTSSKLTYVPGFAIPSLGSVFGVRWEFWN